MIKANNIFLLIASIICISHVTFAKRIFFLGHHTANTVKHIESTPSLWYEQTLDHFRPSDIHTWQQRYFVNESFWVKGGPVFIMIGGEGEANPIWVHTGAWIDYAKKYKALCFLLEHRYYGKSRPTKDMSTKNLKWLSSRQALADLAQFITSMNEEYSLPAGTPWIAFGGSYPGSLAAWLRMKYPHLVHAAVSSSGPLVAKADFEEYFEVVSNALETQSSDCVAVLSAGTSQVKDMIKTVKGVHSLEKLFRLCDPLDTTSELDVASFFETLASNIAGIVQYSGDNREFEGAVGANITIPVLCNVLQNYSVGSPVHRLAVINSMLLDASSSHCFDYRYNKTISDLQHSDWADSGSERQWTWQTCTEFGFYQTSTGEPDLVGDYFPLEYFIKMCEDVFGSRYNGSYIKQAVDQTNIEYGGLALEASRVVFVHGSLDPWHALGITRTLQSASPAIYIKGTAHCANMYPPDSSDLKQLTDARHTVDKLLSTWLSL